MRRPALSCDAVALLCRRPAPPPSCHCRRSAIAIAIAVAPPSRLSAVLLSAVWYPAIAFALVPTRPAIRRHQPPCYPPSCLSSPVAILLSCHCFRPGTHQACYPPPSAAISRPAIRRPAYQARPVAALPSRHTARCHALLPSPCPAATLPGRHLAVKCRHCSPHIP